VTSDLRRAGADGAAGLDARWRSLRARVAWVDHAARAVTRYVEFRGYQLAAAITYFSVLSLLPAAMVSLSVSGYLLAGEPGMLGRLRHGIQQTVPPAVQPLIGSVVDSATEHRFGLGLAGVLVAVYCGWNWTNALRDALTGMWRLTRVEEPLLRTVLKDLLAMLGLGAAVTVVFVADTASSEVGQRVLGILTRTHVHQVPAGAVLASVAASWLIFWWALTALPRVRVSAARTLRPALATAVGFVALRQLADLYLQALGRSPTGVVLGSLVGLLVFSYFVARLLLVAAAWVATAPRAAGAATPSPRPPPPGERRVPDLLAGRGRSRV
jgi:membrane protein